jgi:hypothetical protein
MEHDHDRRNAILASAASAIAGRLRDQSIVTEPLPKRLQELLDQLHDRFHETDAGEAGGSGDRA